MSTRPRKPIVAIAGIALATLLAACSGSASSAPSTTTTTPSTAIAAPSSANQVPATPAGSAPAVVPTDAPAASGGDTDAACTIVSYEDVAKATGFSIATTSGAGSICYFQNADVSQFLVVQLFGSQADMALMTQIEPGSEHIDGLGDDAFWAAAGGILFVRKGDHGVEFIDTGFSFAGGTAARDAMVTLARTAVPKL